MTLLYGGFAKAQLVADVPKIFTLEIMQAEQGFIGIGESTLVNQPFKCCDQTNLLEFVPRSDMFCHGA